MTSSDARAGRPRGTVAATIERKSAAFSTRASPPSKRQNAVPSPLLATCSARRTVLVDVSCPFARRAVVNSNSLRCSYRHTSRWWRVNPRHFTKIVMFGILIKFDSNKHRICRAIESRSPQTHFVRLAAVQKLCEKCGPTDQGEGPRKCYGDKKKYGALYSPRP
jgi:hypothetical protein